MLYFKNFHLKTQLILPFWLLSCFICSYKLWYNYLRLRRRQVKGRCINDPAIEDVNNAHERALVFMHKVRNFFRLCWRLCCMQSIGTHGTYYLCCSLNLLILSTVKPVYNGHSMEKQKVAVVCRWPLYRGSKFSRPIHLFSLIQNVFRFKGIPYIGNFSRREILAKMSLRRCVKYSLSFIFAISRTLNEDV